MATMADHTDQMPYTFKGHPQPPPDVRLKACKNFLADEDINRKLDFKSQLTQIEELLKDLEVKKVPCDPKLYQDVKVMATVQREWLDLMDAPPSDKNPCQAARQPLKAQRLIPREAAREYQDQRNAMRLTNQVREDHVPFTVERRDQTAFLARMREDQAENPETINESTNLLWIENRAYNWALREPSLIPVWLHPRLGLSNGGIKVTDEEPWYRKEVRSAAIRGRPPREELPHYLQYSEDTINRLLQRFAKNLATEQEITQLERFLADFELPSLRKARHDHRLLIQSYPDRGDSEHIKHIRDAENEVREKFKAWLSSFANDGIQFVLGPQPVTHFMVPGVFYVPDEQPTTEQLERIKRCETRANALLKMTPAELVANDDARSELASYLKPNFTPKMNAIIEEIARLVAPTDGAQSQRRDALAEEIAEAEVQQLEPLLGKTVQLSYQRPGEIVYPDPTHAYIKWSPGTDLLQLVDPLTTINPEEDLKDLEGRINKFLEPIDVYPGNLSKKEINAFERELEKVMFPELRLLRDSYLLAKSRRTGRKADAEERDIKFAYDNLCRSWVNSFISGGVRVGIPQVYQPPDAPGVLYLRTQHGLNLQGIRLDELADSINRELQEGFRDQDNPEEQPLYRLLVNVQYPRLKKLDETRRQHQQDPSEDEIRAEQNAHKEWRKAYNSWVATFHDTKVIVQLASHENTTLGDPSIVFYRGPLGRDILPETPESPGERQDPPLLRKDVDHALYLLESYQNLGLEKLAIAALVDEANLLPPSVAGRLEEYKRARAAGAISDIVDAKKNDAIYAFSSWERKVRIAARGLPSPPKSPSTPAISSEMKKEEDLINQLLENPHPDGATLRKLDDLIAPYWSRQLAKLQERRRTRLRSHGESEERIAEVDMSLDTFSVEFQEFKARCRVRGFKIAYIETQPSKFIPQALEPDPGPEPLSPQSRIDISFAQMLDVTQNPWSLSEGSGIDVRDEMFEVEQELNYLLSIQDLRSAEDTEPGKKRSREPGQDNRLRYLLSPFFPANIAHAWDQLKASITSSVPGDTPHDQIRAQRKIIGVYRAFTSLYIPWIRRLEKTTVQLALGSKDKNLENNVDGLLYLDYKPPRRQAISRDAPIPVLPPQWQAVENEINTLMRIGRSRDMTLTEHKRLRALLRVVMPAGIARRDQQLRLLSQQVREATVVQEQIDLYHNAYDNWKREYYEWLNEISPKGVRLFKSVPGDSLSALRRGNVLKIRVTSIDEIPDESMDTTDLPLWCRAGENLFNRYLAGDASVTQQEKQVCADLLYSLWEPYGDAIRQQWKDRLSRIFNTESSAPQLQSSLNAAIEAQIDLSYDAFSRKIVEERHKLRVNFIETKPEIFELKLESSSTENNSEDEKILQSTVNDTSTIRLVSDQIPDYLDQTLRDFFALASKCPNGSSPQVGANLTTQEYAQLKILSKPHSGENLIRLEFEILDLWEALAANKKSTEADRDRFRGLFMRQMWMKLRDLDAKSLSSREIAPQNSTLPEIYESNTVGLTVVDPPTEAQMDAALNNVNTIFTRRKQGTSLPKDDAQLRYVLQPLLPAGLQDTQRKKSGLEAKRKSPTRLSATESIKLANYKISADNQYEQFISSSTNFDFIVNHFWQDQKTLQDFYILTKLYEAQMKSKEEHREKNLMRNEGDKTSWVPANLIMADTTEKTDYSPEIQDPLLRDHQEIRQVLKMFADRYEASYDDKLLLDNMDAPLQSIYEQINTIRNEQRLGLQPSETLRLYTLIEDFARDYMIWYTSLTPEQIQLFRGNEVDFSAKAERRGVQRGAIELALNLFATNQEQHRPHDRFRRLLLPPAYQSPPEEVPLWLPLEPWKRPLELDPFHYTKVMRRYRRWKDYNYDMAREETMAKKIGQVPPPINYNGPFTVESLHGLREIGRKRLNYLAHISNDLLKAQRDAPRPLLQRLNTLIGTAYTPSKQLHPFQDNIPLSESDLDLLKLLCESSWHLDERRPYDNHMQERAQMDEFERDLLEAKLSDDSPEPLLPIWKFPSHSNQQDPSSDSFFFQRPYDPSTSSTSARPLKDVLERVNHERRVRAARAKDDQDIHLWDEKEVQPFLNVMHEFGHIHWDAKLQRVSRVPPTGHPENRYVLSEDNAKNTSYVKFNKATKKYEVQYDAHGTMGPATVQPNKFWHFQKIAFRLGRDIRKLQESLMDPDDSDAAILQKQLEYLHKTLKVMSKLDTASVSDGKDISLTSIARDLLRYTPEFLVDIGLSRDHDTSTLTENEAARIIQLQIIEESNNNWEPRFPEDEHVWDWVDDPDSIVPVVDLYPEMTDISKTTSDPVMLPHDLPAEVTPKAAIPSPPSPTARTNFFSLRKWPLGCQSMAVQTQIKASGPSIVVETPQPVTKPIEKAKPGKERHTGKGGPPSFPFGETPFQQAYQSFRIEQDLADVPEFAAPPESNSLWSRLMCKVKAREELERHKERERLEAREVQARPPIHDPFALPELPAGWIPTSVSAGEKRWDLVQKAKQDTGLSDSEFYSPAELAHLKRYADWNEDVREKARAKAMIVERAGKPLGQIWHAERRKIQDELNIDPVTDRVRPEPPQKSSQKLRKRSRSRSVDSTFVSGGLGEGGIVASSSDLDKVEDVGARPIGMSNSRSPKTTRSLKRGKRTAAEDGTTSGPSPKRLRSARRAYYEETTDSESGLWF